MLLRNKIDALKYLYYQIRNKLQNIPAAVIIQNYTQRMNTLKHMEKRNNLLLHVSAAGCHCQGFWHNQVYNSKHFPSYCSALNETINILKTWKWNRATDTNAQGEGVKVQLYTLLTSALEGGG
jgi:hypothetical protein